MAEPIVAGTKPAVVTMKAGEEVWWCACGRSKSQPFCDGSHEGTGFSPVQYIAEKDGDVYFCTCKHTAKPPLCDGSHKQFIEKNKA